MKTITKEVVTKEVVGYEAFDGERFSTEEACLAYENSGKAELQKRYSNALIKQTTSYGIFPHGNDDDYLDLVFVKDDTTMFSINAYLSLCGGGSIGDSYIGKTIMIQWDYDHCYPWIVGTIDEYIDRIKKDYDKTMEDV